MRTRLENIDTMRGEISMLNNEIAVAAGRQTVTSIKEAEKHFFTGRSSTSDHQEHHFLYHRYYKQYSWPDDRRNDGSGDL